VRLSLPHDLDQFILCGG